MSSVTIVVPHRRSNVSLAPSPIPETPFAKRFESHAKSSADRVVEVARELAHPSGEEAVFQNDPQGLAYIGDV